MAFVTFRRGSEGVWKQIFELLEAESPVKVFVSLLHQGVKTQLSANTEWRGLHEMVQQFIVYENHEIAIAMSSSCADSVLGLDIQFWAGQARGI